MTLNNISAQRNFLINHTGHLFFLVGNHTGHLTILKGRYAQWRQMPAQIKKSSNKNKL